MRNNKIGFWIVSCVLWIAVFILIGLNAIHTVRQNNFDPLFAIAIGIIFVGILCMVCLIKKVFHKIYAMLYSLGEKAEEWSLGLALFVP